MSVLSLLDGTKPRLDTPRRGAAIRLGVTGIVLGCGVIVVLIALRLCLPSVTAYTPYGSTSGH